MTLSPVGIDNSATVSSPSAVEFSSASSSANHHPMQISSDGISSTLGHVPSSAGGVLLFPHSSLVQSGHANNGKL